MRCFILREKIRCVSYKNTPPHRDNAQWGGSGTSRPKRNTSLGFAKVGNILECCAFPLYFRLRGKEQAPRTRLVRGALVGNRLEC